MRWLVLIFLYLSISPKYSKISIWYFVIKKYDLKTTQIMSPSKHLKGLREGKNDEACSLSSSSRQQGGETSTMMLGALVCGWLDRAREVSAEGRCLGSCEGFEPLSLLPLGLVVLPAASSSLISLALGTLFLQWVDSALGFILSVIYVDSTQPTQDILQGLSP